jgi:CheY-like chemotaxis protein
MQPQAHARLRVLIVDDDPWIRETLTFLLSTEGYETLTANDGVEALDTLVASDERLVVVLDLLMPHMTGFEVLTRVAIDDHLATQHGYIVYSAQAPSAEHIGPHFVGLLRRLNIPFIARPFDIDVLLQAVEEIASRLLPPEAPEARGKRGKGRAQGRKHTQKGA